MRIIKLLFCIDSSVVEALKRWQKRQVFLVSLLFEKVREKGGAYSRGEIEIVLVMNHFLYSHDRNGIHR